MPPRKKRTTASKPWACPVLPRTLTSASPRRFQRPNRPPHGTLLRNPLFSGRNAGPVVSGMDAIGGIAAEIAAVIVATEAGDAGEVAGADAGASEAEADAICLPRNTLLRGPSHPGR